MIKYIIFDFDGTIADSQNALVSSWNKLAQDYSFKELKPGEFDAMKKLSIRERSAKLKFKMHMIPIVAPKLYKLYKQSINDVELFGGMKELLCQLEEKGYKTAIISSNSKENILTFLSKNNIKSVTDVICSCSIFGKDKLIKKFLKNNNLEPSEVIYVGDEERDIVACKKAGVKIIWVGWGFDSFVVIEKTAPDYQAWKPEEILGIV